MDIERNAHNKKLEDFNTFENRINASLVEILAAFDVEDMNQVDLLLPAVVQLFKDEKTLLVQKNEEFKTDAQKEGSAYRELVAKDAYLIEVAKKILDRKLELSDKKFGKEMGDEISAINRRLDLDSKRLN